MAFGSRRAQGDGDWPRSRALTAIRPKSPGILDRWIIAVVPRVGSTVHMRPSVSAAEIGLAFVFIGRSFTRIYLGRAVARLGVPQAYAAATAGTGVIPAWVSLAVVGGWALAVVSALSLLVP